MGRLDAALVAFVLGVVLTAQAVGYLHERSMRKRLERQVNQLLEHLELVSEPGGKIYRRALRDVGFAASQALLRVRAERARLIEELDTIEKLLDVAPKE